MYEANAAHRAPTLDPVAYEWSGDTVRVHLGADDDASDAPERSVLVDVVRVDSSPAFGAEYDVRVLDVRGGGAVSAWADEHREDIVDAYLGMQSHREYRALSGAA